MVSGTLQPLPNELWAEIFASLPHNALACVHLTSRLFAHIVKPFLFRALEFHPYVRLSGYRTVACPPSGLGLPRLEHIDSARQRLSYWSSSDIAPLVRACSVTPWVVLGGMAYSAFSRADDPYVLLTGLFDALPSFTHLCNLAFKGVHFTQQHIGNLYLLPNLMALEVEYCSVVLGTAIDTTILAPLPITHFAFTHDASGDNMDHWVPLLPVDKLVHLRLQLYGHVRLFDQIQAGDDFTCVKSLQMPSLGSLSRPWTRILSKFPAVESLILDQHFACDVPPHAPISDVLPSLREYQGPSTLLHFFLASPTLRHVDIPFWYTKFPTGNDVLAYFQGFVGPNRITTLQAEFVQFDHVFLAGLGIAFPNLAELHIKVLVRGNGEAPFEADALFEAMAWHSRLTLNIRKFALSWKYLSSAKRTPVLGCPDVNELKDALVSQHPELKVVWVDGLDTMYLWRKGHDVVQYTDDSAKAYPRAFVVRLLEVGLHSK
ncbi:hypothetical protein B0H16DRAFT_1517117 [Mycena metata]|uniref:F-box domain-containing protein n=1 Tax=Mycena metata TaxID=1033252 RepID=A0AAD7JQX5_9AGAR|nr:hypothetical protein B0H16DRAFT_1517117 [Mycena metata]